MHVIQGHAAYASAEVQQVLDDVGHARLAVVLARVGAVVGEQHGVGDRVVPPGHSEHHHLA